MKVKYALCATVCALVSTQAWDAGAALVSNWKFDETSGQTAADSAGTSPGQLGTTALVDASDPVINQAGKFGKAYSFTAADFDRVDVGNFAPFTSLSTGSITGWFSTSAGARSAILNIGESSSADRLIIETNSGKLRLVIRNSNTNLVDLTTVAAYNDNTFHHFALTQDGSGVKVYIDGSEVTGAGLTTNANGTAWFNSVAGLNNMTLGYEKRSNGEFALDGSLDDIAIFDHALSTTELANVVALGAASYNVPEPGTLALLGLGGLLIARRRRA